MVLYILGNGFDRAHGMKTSYWDFEEFVKANYSDKKILYDNQYSVDNLWRSFEENLDKLDIPYLLSTSGTFELSENENDTLNTRCDDWFAGEINKGLVCADDLKEIFSVWVEGIDIPTRLSIKKYNLKDTEECLYINFNYTPALQKLYKIKSEKVLHIHGRAGIDSYKDIIVGHGSPDYCARKIPYIDTDGEVFETDDVDLSSIYAESEEHEIMLESIASYLNDLKKPTSIISRNLVNFLNIRLGGKKISKICVLGHSCGAVDMPYFMEIQNYAGRDVEWEIAYHNKKNVKGMEQRLIKTGLDMTKIKFISDRIVSYRLKKEIISPITCYASLQLEIGLS